MTTGSPLLAGRFVLGMHAWLPRLDGRLCGAGSPPRSFGHVNAVKAALGGAASGLLFGAWFAHDGTSLLAILACWAGFGALVGAVIALVGHVLSGGRRNYASITAMQAQRVDVLVDEAFADEVVRRLGAGGIQAP